MSFSAEYNPESLEIEYPVGGTSTTFGKLSFFLPEEALIHVSQSESTRKFVAVRTTNLYSTWRCGRMRYFRIFVKRKREKLHLVKDEPAV